jgi:uncharacterized protein YgbK (DUF1537 family)
MPTVLGVIADDFTGATDVASMLVRGGMRTVQVIGVPRAASGPAPDADAVVVALKSRTVPAADAVAQSLAALRWLRAAGASRFYFKVCSTFDSTPAGNIGPVARALMEALPEARIAIVCPAFPENGRTVYRGHLFVGDLLLSDSGMRHHPLTPMTDASLVRVLQAQLPVDPPWPVALLPHEVVVQGPAAIRRRLEALHAQGARFAVADAIANADLLALGDAVADAPLLVAGSGVALGLPPAYAARGLIAPDAQAATLAEVGGAAAVLSGSCSVATNTQVAAWIGSGRPAFRIDPRALAAGAPAVAEALEWAAPRLAAGPVLIYATSAPDEVKAVQAALGAERAGALVEHALASIAQGLVERGVRRLVVAGGETSGAVVGALGVTQLRIGATIAPGVPWTQAGGRPLLLALKSGNFGGERFFEEAIERSR